MPRILIPFTLFMLMLAWSNTAAACPICETNGNAVVFKLNQSEWGIFYKALYEKINDSKSKQKANSMVKRGIWSWDKQQCRLSYDRPSGGTLTLNLGLLVEAKLKSPKEISVITSRPPNSTGPRLTGATITVLGDARRTVIHNLIQTLGAACKQANRS